jgi:hypothetical protein
MNAQLFVYDAASSIQCCCGQMIGAELMFGHSHSHLCSDDRNGPEHQSIDLNVEIIAAFQV